jgi:hypothetical protein
VSPTQTASRLPSGVLWTTAFLAFSIVLLATSLFFGKPWDLRRWIHMGNVDVTTLPSEIGSTEHVRLKRPANGIVHVGNPVEIRHNGVLEIEPGVTLEMSPDTYIHCEGTIFADGTAEHPITFQASDTERGWKNISVYNPVGTISRFSHCEFRNATGRSYYEPPSTAIDDRLQFVPASSQNSVGGALVIFSTRDLELNDCTFFQCRARHGGAVYIRDGTNIHLRHCSFRDNFVSSRLSRAGGGAFSCWAVRLTLMAVDSFGTRLGMLAHAAARVT